MEDACHVLQLYSHQTKHASLHCFPFKILTYRYSVFVKTLYGTEWIPGR